MAIRFTWITAKYRENSLDMFACGKPTSINDLIGYTKFSDFISKIKLEDIKIIYKCETWLYGNIDEGIEDADVYMIASFTQRYSMRGMQYFKSANLLKENSYTI